MSQSKHQSKPNKKNISSRSIALSILQKVLIQSQSLSRARSHADLLEARDRAFAMELVNGVLRWRWKLEYILMLLMKKPLKSKDQNIQIILMLALHELVELSSAEYAVVHEAVQLSRDSGKSWASGLVNGVLRSFIRDRESILSKVREQEEASYSHPAWLIDLLKKDWPDYWRSILQSNNVRPPLWLRANVIQNDTDVYAGLLEGVSIQVTTHPYARQALKLDSSLSVPSLPGFGQGKFSIQDAGAQLAAELLDVKPGMRVLDLCAAPGGKACHLLESQPEIKTLVAVELEEDRMERVRENLSRLNLKQDQFKPEVILIVGDSTKVSQWWDGECFDRILVDAPCSATGVIRRHPDIKSLRREQDLVALGEIQQQILQQALQMLVPGGLLLYATCSVLKQENEAQVENVLNSRDDVNEKIINAQWGVPCSHGRQLLTGDDDTDGFYYALLCKQSATVA